MREGSAEILVASSAYVMLPVGGMCSSARHSIRMRSVASSAICEVVYLVGCCHAGGGVERTCETYSKGRSPGSSISVMMFFASCVTSLRLSTASVLDGGASLNARMAEVRSPARFSRSA